MSMAESHRRLTVLIAQIKVRRRKAGLPRWKPGDPTVLGGWNVLATLVEHAEQLRRAMERREGQQNTTQSRELTPVQEKALVTLLEGKTGTVLLVHASARRFFKR
jgi:hypothetical protein